MSIFTLSRSPRAWQWVFFAGVAILLFFSWPRLSKLAGQIALALLLCACALPLEKRMEKRCSRPLAAGCAVAAILMLLVGFILLLVPSMIAQFSHLINEVPRLMTLIQALWQRISESPRIKALSLPGDIPGKLIGQIGAWAAEIMPRILAALGAWAEVLSRAFLSPILAYYFLRDREVFTYRLSLWIPLKHRKKMLTALREMRREAGEYIRGQLMVAAAVSVLTALGLLAVGAPSFLVLGLLMGVCELIPYVGPLIGGVPIALFSLSKGFTTMLWALGVTIAVQQIEGYFLSPKLMAGAIGLHPVWVLLLLTAGGLLGGLPGMVLALPVFVCLRGAARVLYETLPAKSAP